MSLITMPREMGSLGVEVAAEVAKRLGKSVIHHEISDQLANKMRLRKSHVVRFLEGKAGILEKMATDETSLSIYTADEIFRLAESGEVAVIRGWGATHLLNDVPHVVRVRVCAPYELRVTRMMERLKTDDRASVEKEIRLSEEAHTAITRRHFDLNWRDAEHYDAILNTERMSVTECADALMAMLKLSRYAQTTDSRQKLRDLSLAAYVRAALRNDERTEKLLITVTVTNGQAELSGTTEASASAESAATVAAATPGITGVSNKLQSRDRRFSRLDS